MIASQSPENGSQHCKEKAGWELVRFDRDPSQSPENGSQHCKILLLGAILFAPEVSVAIP